MIPRPTALVLMIALLILSGCGGGAEEEKETEPISIKSGTHAGMITAVNPEETEIYVEFQNGSIHGLYFTNSTKVTGLNGTTVPFDSLARGQSIDVTVERCEQDLNPRSVTIKQQGGEQE